MSYVTHESYAVGWLWVVGSLKLYISFAKEPYKRDDILQKNPIFLRRLLIVATPYAHVVHIICDYRSLLQNIVSFIGLFCKRDYLSHVSRVICTLSVIACHTCHSLTRVNESCHTYECRISIGWEMLMNESCRLRMSHVSYECVTSHLNTPMSHIYSHGIWRIHERHDSCVRDTSHMNTPMSHMYSYELWLIHTRLIRDLTHS